MDKKFWHSNSFNILYIILMIEQNYFQIFVSVKFLNTLTKLFFPSIFKTFTGTQFQKHGPLW